MGLTFNPLNPLLSLLLQRNPLELDFKEGDLIFFHQTSCYSFNKKERRASALLYLQLKPLPHLRYLSDPATKTVDNAITTTSANRALRHW